MTIYKRVEPIPVWFYIRQATDVQPVKCWLVTNGCHSNIRITIGGKEKECYHETATDALK